MQYSIGVIIPIYNMEEYLAECLESVVNQTVSFDEVILINDGSFDKSKQICEQYCEKFSYFKLINQKNQGLGAARNNGMLCLKSDYFIFLDSDDYIDLHMVEIIKKRLSNQDVVFYSASIKESMEGITHSNTYIRDEKMNGCSMSGLEYFYQSFPTDYIVSSCMAIYKRKFIEKHNILFPEGMYYEDNYFYIKVILNAKEVSAIPNQFYVRRYRFNSITISAMDERKCLDRISIQIKIWNYIKEYGKEKLRADILYQYLLKGVSEVMWSLEQYKKIQGAADFSDNVILFSNKFMEYWGSPGTNILMSLDSCYTMLTMYSKLMDNGENYRKKYIEVEVLFIKLLKEKLKQLHLDDESLKIGIYGVGKHTKAMIDLYEQYIGKVRCQYYYILSEISNKYDELMEQEHFIVSYNNIPQDTDLIIISSLVYMNDMLQNLKCVKTDTKKIHLIYDKNEIFDLVMINESINKK